MQKFLLYTFLLFFLGSQSIFASGILKPSLMNQMKYQEEVIKKNIVQEKKYNNMMRLAEIRKKQNITIHSTSAPAIKTLTPSLSIVSSNKQSAVRQNTTQIFSNTIPSNILGVDMTRVRSSWFGWYNEYRRTLWMSPYGHEPRLDITSHDWNILFAQWRWKNHHTRNTWDGYYNFTVIDRWFQERGINPKVINRSKHTENVGYGYYSCNQWDCTDELIGSIRSTFDFFMSEKGKSYDTHYRSIINPYFTKMGFDIIVVPSEERYYITVHYVTSL